MGLENRAFEKTRVKEMAIVLSSVWGTKYHRAARGELMKMYEMGTIDDAVNSEPGRDIITNFLAFANELLHPIALAIQDELNKRLAVPP